MRIIPHRLNNNSKKFRVKDIKSRRFEQESLEIDLTNASAGQSLITKIILLSIVNFLVFLLCIFTGYLQGGAGLYIILGTEYCLSYLVTTLVIATWIITAIYQDFGKTLLTAILVMFIVIAGLELLARFELLEFPHRFYFITLGIIVVELVIFSVSFLIFRFAIALADILFIYSHITKIIGIPLIIFAATVGSLTAISAATHLPGSEVKRIFTTSTDAEVTNFKIITIVSGIVFSLGLALSSWLANRLRYVPWNHPNLLRDWALAAGSWWGTSFHNLDLSEVNFRGARLANTDLRVRKLYRTCLQDVTGLERARVDSRYLDLENLKVQRLLTHGYSENKDFSRLNLRGAYLQNADLRHFKLINTDLTGADLQGADLQGSILACAQVISVDFTNANLTGVCIEDWSVNSQTDFTNVQCNYIYRKLDEKGEPTDRYPIERNFESREFESLYQEVGNVVELIFKEGVNWRAFSFSLQKLQLEDDGLGLELKGVEKRGDRWVVKITHNESAPRQEVEQRVYEMYNEMKNLLAAKEQQINKLLGIAADQAETLKKYSKQPFGNSFFIVGSTVTNLAGSGQIDYDEAAGQVRSIVANGGEPTQVTTVAQTLLRQLQGQSVATTSDMQAELIQQVILTEAQKDPFFKQFLVQQGQQVAEALPESAIASAIRYAIAQLS